jgi:hypothetical protein
MPVIHFDLVCPDIASKGTKAIRVLNDRELPDGDYYFMEMFCDNSKCDCKEAIIEVYEKNIGMPLATILYRWGETVDEKSHSGLCATCRSGVVLVSDGNQSAIAEPLRDLFAECIEERGFDTAILQHYKMFKLAVAGKGFTPRSGRRDPKLKKRR